MTRERMKQIAIGNIERNLSDAAAEDGLDALHDTVYTLAFDALFDAGVSRDDAQEVALYLAQGFCHA